ncbi:MAG: hypothetical protein Q8920_12820 [Bacillota bacterium]|nr:hypothetical protein [Bacillota bacterium]
MTGNLTETSLVKKINTSCRNIFSYMEKLSSDNDDRIYIKQFNKLTGPKIYQMHLNEYLISCAFCSHLSKSSCHEYCFKCSKGVYLDCSFLLPGTFSFSSAYFDNSDDHQPWIFKTPCSNFERLPENKYFRNFSTLSKSKTAANYEALEGIFTGLSRGKRPCHICASVNMEIYDNCSCSSASAETNPCDRIIDQISARYRAILGVIKSIE